MLGELRAPQKDTALILRTDDIPGAQPKKINHKTSKKARGFFPENPEIENFLVKHKVGIQEQPGQTKEYYSAFQAGREVTLNEQPLLNPATEYSAKNSNYDRLYNKRFDWNGMVAKENRKEHFAFHNSAKNSLSSFKEPLQTSTMGANGIRRQHKNDSQINNCIKMNDVMPTKNDTSAQLYGKAPPIAAPVSSFQYGRRAQKWTY